MALEVQEVFVLLSQKYDFKLIETTRDKNGRFVLLNISINDSQLVIVNIYAPTRNFQEQWQQFISYITENLMQFMGKQIISGGDFNTYMDPVLDKKWVM